MKKFFIKALFSLFLVGFFSSCEIGLGNSVDTEVPQHKIQTPDPDSVAIIRGAFPIKGTWTDDGEIDSVTVTIKNDTTTVYSEKAVVTNPASGSGTWSCVVSPEEKGILDGSYFVSVTIKDKSEHSSVTTSQIRIDNTPPLIVLNHPSTVAEDDSLDTYGTVFSLNGEAADDSGVDLIEVTVYSDPEKQNKLLDIPLTYVPNTIKLKVAEFKDGEDNDYAKIYGSTTTNGEQSRYCTIVAYDGAKRYPLDGEELSDDDKKGNSTNVYYLKNNEEVSALLKQYKVTGLYQMMAGTYEDDAARSVTSNALTILKDNEISLGAFALDPENNPKYIVSSKYEIKDSISKDTAKLINNSSLVIEVAPGLDGTAIDSSSLKVYAVLCDADGKELNEKKLYPVCSEPKKINTSYQIAATFTAGKFEENKFKTNEYYKIGVEGCDVKGVDVIPANKKGYGFYFTTSGILPTVTVACPSDEAVFKAGSDVIVSGTVNFLEDGVFSITLIDDKTGEETILVPPVAEDNGVKDDANLAVGQLSYIKDKLDEHLFHFKYIIPAEKFNQDETKKYTLRFSNPNADTTILYDAQEPEIEFKFTGTSDDNKPLGPLARKFKENEAQPVYADDINYVNGTFTFEYKVKDEENGSGVDTGTNQPVINIYEQGVSAPKKTFKFNAETKTVDVDTTVFTDGKDIIIEVKAHDASGNETVKTQKYTLNSSTDIPLIYAVSQADSKPLSLERKTRASVENQNEYNTLSADDSTFKLKFFDDDGLVGKKLAVNIKYDKDGNNTDVREADLECVPDENGAEESFTIPEVESGFYKITVTAKDKVGDAEATRIPTSEEFWIRITPSAPTVRINDLTSRYLTNAAGNTVSNATKTVIPEVIIDSTEKPFRITRCVTYKDSEGNVSTKEEYKKYSEITEIEETDNSTLPALTLNSDGTYTYRELYTPSSSYDSGEYSISYKVYDCNGNSTAASETDSVAFFIDNQRETITEDDITVPTATENAGTSFTFKVNVTPNGMAPVTYYWAFTDGNVTTAPASFTSTPNQNYKLTYSTAAWAEGKKKIWVYIVDEAGNKSNVQSKEFYYDLSKPTVAFVEKSFDTREVFSLNVNAQDSWGLESLELFQITDNVAATTGKKVTGIAISAASPNWTITGLPAASIAVNTFEEHKYFVRATDKAGKTTDSNTITVRIDNKKPSISAVKFGSENSTILRGTLGEIKVTAKDEGLGLSKLNYTITKQGSNTPASSGEINLAGAGEITTVISKELGAGKDLPEGKYSLSLKLSDLAGNVFENAASVFYVDLADPVISNAKIQAGNGTAEEITETDIKYLNTTSKLTLSGTITESNRLEKTGLVIKVNDVEIDAGNITLTGSAPTYTFTAENITIPKNNEGISINVSAADIANYQPANSTYTIYNDTEKPEITFITPSKSVDYSGNNSISGTKYNFNLNLADNGSKLKTLKYCIENWRANAQTPESSWTLVNTENIQGKLSSGYAFEKTLKASGTTGTGDLSEGHYNLFVYVEDSVGNSKTDKVAFFIDQKAPELECSAITPTGGQTIDGYVVSNVLPVLTITASDTNTSGVPSIKVTSGDNPAAFTEKTVDDTGKVSFTTSELSEGKHKIIITATDVAGRAKKEERFVWIDTKAPAGTITIESEIYKDASLHKWYDDSNITISLSDVKDAGGSGIYQAVASSDNTNWYPISLSETNGVYSGSGTINCANQGKNTIKIRIIDNAGKEKEQTEYVYIDTSIPDVATITALTVGTKTESTSGIILVNGDKNMTIKLEAKDRNPENAVDYASDIASVEIKGVDGTKVTTAGNDGYYSLSIPSTKIGSGEGKIASGAIIFLIKDNVGNSYEYISDLVLDLDNTKPSVAIDPVTDADPDTSVTDVNETFKISGTASDNNALASIALEYKIEGDNDFTPYPVNVTGVDIWSIDIDTSSDNSIFKDIDKKNVTFQVIATDTAQNSKTSSPVTVYINQASDIPVITFTDFDVSEMSAAKPLLSESNNIYCSVYDDDGEVTLKYSKNGGTSYDNTIDVSDGSFTLTLEDGTYDSSTGDKKKKAIMFEVTEADSSTPCNTPRIKGKIKNNTKTTSTENKLFVKIDKTDPRITGEKYSSKLTSPESGDWKNDFVSQIFGGDAKQFLISVNVEDENDIEWVKAGFGTDETKFVELNLVDSVYKSSTPVSVSGLESGQNKLIIKASDGINIAEKEVTVTIDNTPPVVTVDSHSNNEMIHKDFVLEGNIEESDSGTKLYYVITKSGIEIPEASTAENTVWNEVTGNSTLRWKIHFDQTSNYTNVPGQECRDLLPKYIVARENPDTVEINENGIVCIKGTQTKYTDTETYNFNFFAVDNLGNISEVKTLPLKLDPQGDIPGIVLEYPAAGTIVSGVLRMSGSAEFVNEPKALYMQIDPQFNESTFDDDNWETKEFPNGKTFADYSADYDIRPIGNGKRGIYIGNGLSWSKTINMNSEFEPNTDVNNIIAVKLFAVDNLGNISSTEDDIYVLEVNAGAPKIGSSEPLILKQFDASGNAVNFLSYKEGMWIKGEWYLTGSVEDDDGIYSITVKDENNVPVSNAYETTEVTGVWKYANKDTRGYRLKIPVGNSTGAKKLKYTITVSDGDDTTLDKDRHETEMLISVNYDNNAPEIAEVDSSEENISSNIYNQNGKNYSMESVATESSNESGYSRTVYYFTAENGKVYDSSWTQVTSAGSFDDLYWKSNKAGTITNATIKLEQADTNIKVDSLARIGGVIYSIIGVNAAGDEVTLDSAPDKALENKPIYFVLGNVVQKKGISNVGTKTRWTETFDSTQLPDGAVKLSYVVFDKAGNHIKRDFADALVKNNAPRLASVKVGTDYNGDGNIADSEYKIKYYSSNVRWFKDENNVYQKQEKPLDAIRDNFIIGDETTAFTTVHGAVRFIPEIIGGNTPGANDYLEYCKGTSATATRTSLIVKGVSEADYTKRDDYEQSYIQGNSATINCAFNELTHGLNWCTYTIWDKTAGSKQLSVTFKVRLNVIKTDSDAPETDMSDFFWDSETKNSLYHNKKSNGHIELPADFKDLEQKNAQGTMEKIYAASKSDEYDLDPKVSGKITMSGSVYDNVRVSGINIKIDGVGTSAELPFSDYTPVASYANGAWILVQDDDESSDALSDGWAFTITDEYNDERGHKANWEFSWDTSLIQTVAKTDVKVYIQATDEKPNGSTAETSDDNFKQMDVVPYITSVVTSIGDGATNIYARTARGHYPERSGETLKLNGFNLAKSNAQVANIALPASSGIFEHSVAGVSILNNKNSDVVYNKQPNNKNNNSLTDDVVIDIWEFDSTAITPKKGTIEQPIMKINPVTDKIGFAFGDGPLNFNMGGRTRDSNQGTNTGAPKNGVDNRTEYSYHTWLAGYDTYSSIAFAYDKNGNSYGIAAGGDISGANDTDFLSFFTGKWGNSNYSSQEGSKGNAQKLRLSQIGQVVDNKNVQNKQRNMIPSLATSVRGNNTNIYFAYYDALNKQLRFKAGSTDFATAGNYVARANFGDFRDIANQNTPMTYAADTVYMDIIAGKDSSNATATYDAGKYSCVGVDSHGTSDIAVITWYDETHSTLWYAYNSSPLSNAGTPTARTGDSWNISRVFAKNSSYSRAGEYVQLAVDAKGGVHIAAYDPIGCNLVYAYSPTSEITASTETSGFTTCVIDSYGIVGSNISLDIAMTESGDSGKVIPYIGYYSSSSVKPKFATIPEGIGSAADIKDGAGTSGTEKEKYTGIWECSLLPTSSHLHMNSKQYNHINVCSWKDSSGVLKTTVSNNTSLSHTREGTDVAYNSKVFGHVSGNGTNKPILAYNVSNGTAVETAQMK